MGATSAGHRPTRAELRAAREAANSDAAESLGLGFPQQRVALADAGPRPLAEPAEPATGAESPPRPLRRRSRATFSSVLGELLITVGMIVLLFVVWQLWVNDAIEGAANNESGLELSQQWDQSAPAEPAAPDEPATPPGEIPVAAPPAEGEEMGVLWVPRFGSDYHVRMAGGTSRSVTLDPIGIGHYEQSEMPGEVGNTAYAAHRTGYGGAPFYEIAELRAGDPIIIETRDGWYTYRFRNLEYVQPSQTGVLSDVPREVATPAGERYLTLTSCSPKHTINERIIAYAAFDSFTPRADGPPDTIAASSAAGAES